MNFEEQDIVMIERYLEGNLEEQERVAFDQRLKTDEEFQQWVTHMESMVNGIKYTGRKNVMKQLAELEANLPEVQLLEEEQEESNIVAMKPNKFRYWAAAAAAIALVLISSLFLLTYNSGQSDQDLFTAYYEPYSGDLSRSGDEDLVDKRERAYFAYGQGQHERAIPLFEEVIDQEPTSKLRFYLGNAYLSVGEAEKAAQQFKEVLRDSDYPLQDQSRWYLALSYLKAEKLDMAQTTLEEITGTPGSFYYNKAQELLAQIK